MNDAAYLELMIKIGIVGTIFGFLFSAMGKGNITKFVAILTGLICVSIVAKVLMPVAKEMFALLRP